MKRFIIIRLILLSMVVTGSSLLLNTTLPAKSEQAGLNLFPSFIQPQFASRWYYSDKAIVENSQQLTRSWTWGPASYSLPGGATTEPYQDAPDGLRSVQYFDKARMELNSKASSGSIYEVTTGLLVKELVTGLRQDGDNSFTQLNPSTHQVAGDSNSSGNNQVAPVYSSFGKVIFKPGDKFNPNRSGQFVDQAIDRSGQVSLINPPFNISYGGFNSVTGHNIAGVFSRYFNLTGLIWNGTSYEAGSPFFNNPTYIFGLPLTEPYWIRAVVNGQETDVLVQLFERRTLTYTPTNPDPFKVEMGNVGQHYYLWRYGNLPDQTKNTLTITMADSGRTITLNTGDRFVLSLGESYDWTIDLSNEGIIQRIVNITPIRGSQGVYEALKTGKITLTATGEPGCRKAQPPCQAPSRLFTLYVIVQ